MLTEALDSELLDVARSLCDVAAACYLLGSVHRAECLLEQAADLLTERARQLSRQQISSAEALQ